jgi:hypothetical protein
MHIWHIRLSVALGATCWGAIVGSCWLFPLGGVLGAADEKPKPAAAGGPTNGLGLVVSPLPDWFKFQSLDTVNGWINDQDTKSITTHAWELWGALSTMTDQELNGEKVPVYETWWDRDEALAAPGMLAVRKKNVRLFERPRQLNHTQGAKRDAAGRPPPCSSTT